MSQVRIEFIFDSAAEAKECLPGLFQNGHRVAPAVVQTTHTNPVSVTSANTPSLTFYHNPPSSEALATVATGGGPKGSGSRKGKGAAAEHDVMQYLNSFAVKWVSSRVIVSALKQPKSWRRAHPPGTTRGALVRLMEKGFLERRDASSHRGHEYRRTDKDYPTD